MLKIVIPGRFPSLNEYIAANKKRSGNWNAGNAMKKRDQTEICRYLPKDKTFKKRIFIQYTFFEPNTRRDKDNISGYFHKIFQDAMVQAGMIRDDGWAYIYGMADYFEIDTKYPRIEVIIEVKR